MMLAKIKPSSTRLSFCLLCLLCASGANVFSLDREAFSITDYDLNVRVEPEQHRLGVRGKVTLRNDSPAPQKIAVLQISSSLDWRSIKAGDTALQFVTQPYTSDIDHTGALSEAIVTLPQAVVPQGSVDLDIGYEGVVLLDATRLTRIGTPEDMAKGTDWDQIDRDFTAVRGAGYVAWYPIATESANLSDENSLSEVLGRWKAREADSKVHVGVRVSRGSDEQPPELLVNQPACGAVVAEISGAQYLRADCVYRSLASLAPAFVIGGYSVLQRAMVDVHFLHGHDIAAASYAEQAEKIGPFISEWFGVPREKAKTAELPDRNAAPFESGGLFLTPLGGDSKLAGLAAAHQLTHAAFLSPRPWIEEGLAHFAQALYLEHEKGRRAALDYMQAHRSGLSQLEKQVAASPSADETNRSLINTSDEERYRSKGMCVWWMLRDMVGDTALRKAFSAYHPEQDKEPSYMPRLIAAETQRDLQWFFDDWIYHDRGLPDFKVESAHSQKTSTSTFLVAITVENLGTAGAEVPFTVKFAGGDVTKRIEVRAKSKATIRVETPAAPLEVVVNDGSVPESDITNNVFKVEIPGSSHGSAR